MVTLTSMATRSLTTKAITKDLTITTISSKATEDKMMQISAIIIWTITEIRSRGITIIVTSFIINKTMRGRMDKGQGIRKITIITITNIKRGSSNPIRKMEITTMPIMDLIIMFIIRNKKMFKLGVQKWNLTNSSTKANRMKNYNTISIMRTKLKISLHKCKMMIALSMIRTS